MGWELVDPDLRVIVFIDGQNLYHLAKDAWNDAHGGYHWPKYDVSKIAAELVRLEPERHLEEIRFYTGVPRSDQNARWHGFWTRKIRAMQSAGIKIYKGKILKGREKGVDVRIALDLVRETRKRLTTLP